ncbi:LysR family transcriptional regulator [Bdellovibrio sp. BCCA]|uniref:LysR family transcriptional regulator n=1 Tax=Bdellovibrio sp. BCCA TaxID=3136281 RepID=UPI0030F32FD0
MDTDRLRYFCLIAETGSLTKASELLNISHSGLSKAMTQLQGEVNQTLFRPQGRGLELTEEGKTLYIKSIKVLEMVEDLKARETVVAKQVLRIGMTEIFSVALARDIVESLETPVSIYDFDSGEIEVKLLEDEIDFAISTVPFPHQHLEYLKITKTFMGVFHKNRDFKNLSLEEIPFVGPNSEIKNNPLSLRSRDGWPEQLKRRLVYGASTLPTALGIVDAGAAAIFIPRFLAAAINEQRTPGLHLLEYETHRAVLKSAARDIYLVKRKNREETKEMKAIARILRKRC